MRILHTSAFYHPRSGGAEEVVRQISERLAVRGHDVTVATTKLPERKSSFHHGVQIAEFPIHGVLGHSALGIRGDAAAFSNFLQIGNWDVIMNYAAQTWPTDTIKVDIPDKLAGHRALLPKLSDDDLHNLTRYLLTIK